MIKQELTVPASPDRVYTALTDSAQFSKMTGDKPADIGHGEGAAFSMFGGAITGRHLELAPCKRIVQAWRAGNWPASHYSIVSFTLTPAGAGTKIVLEHSAYPEDMHDHLIGGWKANYLEPLTKMFA